MANIDGKSKYMSLVNKSSVPLWGGNHQFNDNIPPPQATFEFVGSIPYDKR